MTNLKLKVTSAIVTSAFLIGVVLPSGAFAANDVTVSENGASSVNKVKIKTVKKSKVKQNNSSAVTNSVGVTQNTGGNNANKNTGGDVAINSGNATSNVTINNTTGGNNLVMEDCGCPDSDNNIDISGNGSDSVNKVKISSYSKHVVKQSNSAVIVNGVSIGQNTGDNKANSNTGGSVEINSGDADATVEINNTTGDNVLGPSI